MSGRMWTVAALVVLAACSPPAAPGVDEIVGEWEKPEETLPPIHLAIRRKGDGLHARLSLSGVQLDGEAALRGSTLELTFEGRPGSMTGEFSSKEELLLELSAGGRFRLVKVR